MITLIVGRDRNGAIGKENDIPWHVSEDLNAFKRETLGGALIMGRNTWDSLPVKPLKNRLNLVVSSNPEAAEFVCPSLEAAIDEAKAQGYQRIYGIGGFGIYRDMLKVADRLLITEIDLAVEDADTFFPEFDETDWKIVNKTELRSDAPTSVMVEYLRRVV